MPDTLRRAHAEGWRVSTHVETAADFHHALVAGVDQVNHLPGFRPHARWAARAAGFELAAEQPLSCYAIAEADARRAAEKATVVVTTVGSLLRGAEAAPDGTSTSCERAASASRSARTTTTTPRRRSWTSSWRSLACRCSSHTSSCARGARKRRARSSRRSKLGVLAEGHEASFLVLGGDPLADPEHVRDVRLRVKQGRVLERTR